MRGKKWIQGLCLATVTVIMSGCSGGGSDCPGGDKVSHLGVDYCEVTSPYTGTVWLDRNLGASQVCTAYNDPDCYGDHYQWGRNGDGHEDSTSPTTNTQADNVANVNNGGLFIESNSTYSYDWAQAVDGDGSQRVANWSKTDGSFVCPVGYRVPTKGELKAELFDTDSAKIQNREDAFNSFLKLPSAGYRGSTSASMYNQGSWGDVWSSSASGSYASLLFFNSDDAGWSSSDARAGGLSVRCLKEDG